MRYVWHVLIPALYVGALVFNAKTAEKRLATNDMYIQALVEAVAVSKEALVKRDTVILQQKEINKRQDEIRLELEKYIEVTGEGK